MKIRPTGGMVLVKREDPEAKSPGGIIIPDTAQKLPCRGEVLAVGPGRVEEDGVFREVQVRTGERILWDRMGAHEVPEHPELRLVSSAYLLGVVEP